VSTIDRRELLRRAGSASLAGLALTAVQVEAAHEHVAKAKAAAASGKAGPYKPRLFDAHEWATVHVLADMILPADERSGSASDALVPEFIDAIATDELAEAREREDLQTRLRGGLRWLDRETRGRFGREFVDCAEGERKTVLDAIAWPEQVAAGLEPGAAFFTLLRDLVASGFWSSKAGVEDLRYVGNTFVAEWSGCPAEVVARVGGGGKR
jgi:gluconate 2-dehydrogenase gamma chain